MLSNLFLNRSNANNHKVSETQNLIINGKEICSLDELRENFDAEGVLKALNDGSLKSFFLLIIMKEKQPQSQVLHLKARIALKRYVALLKLIILSRIFL